MDDRETLLVCYRSGQMSAAQWERHCEDDPELRALLDRQGLISKEGVAAIENAEEGPIRWVWSDGSCHGEPESSFTAPRAMTDPIAAMREALKDIAVYGCGMLRQPAAMNGPEESWLRMRIAAYEQRARAALASYDAAEQTVRLKDEKGGDANDGEGPSERSDDQNRPVDASPGVKTEAIGSVAAMREALKEIDARRYRRLFSNHPWLLSDFGNAYSCGSQQAHEECSDIARAALAAYDAAVSPSRQSMDVEAMARELAKRASSGDTLAQSRIESNLLSFAARVAADQRERDAKIAETPDPQLANKTAAQIAAAIRASAKPF